MVYNGKVGGHCGGGGGGGKTLQEALFPSFLLTVWDRCRKLNALVDAD